jgi:hypothetical protein
MHLNIVNSRCVFMFVSMFALYSFVLCKCFQPLSFWAAFKFVWSQLFLKSMFWFLHFWEYYASDAQHSVLCNLNCLTQPKLSCWPALLYINQECMLFIVGSGRVWRA